MARLRVIAGSAKGTSLRTGRGRWLRPTTDRAREVLFDWLGDRVRGSRVLDLFCGTGALGIEALSRGAREAIFVDVRTEAVKLVRLNLEAAGLTKSARVLRADFRFALRAPLLRQGGFELVLADPPYGRQSLLTFLLAGVSGLLDNGGVFVLERSKRVAVPRPSRGSVLVDERFVGQTVFALYEREGT